MVDFVHFELDELRCAVDAAPVVEVVRAAALRPIAGQPEFVAGVIDYRGAILPVLDVRVRFGRARTPLTPAHRYIIVRIRERVVALWVDRIVDVGAVHIEDVTEPEGLIQGTRSLAGIGRGPGGIVMIHDVEAFLTQSEADGLTALGATA